MRHLHCISLLLSALMCLVACEPPGTQDDAASESPGDTLVDNHVDDATAPNVIPDEICRDYAGDFDGDGILNAIEDANLNCLVDPTETDPRLADTDGDCLSDSEEDFNRDGLIDGRRGECDPTNPDSDGDGISDCTDPDCLGRDLWCRPDTIEVDLHPMAPSGSSIVLPPGYVSTPQHNLGASTFHDPTGKAFGFVVLGSSSGDPGADLENALANLASSAPTRLFVSDFQIPGPTWNPLSEMAIDPTRGQRGAYRFDEARPATVRDGLLAAYRGTSFTSGAAQPTCDSVRANVVATLRPGGEVVLTAIFACQADYDSSQDIQTVFDDVLGGTIVAPGEFAPWDFVCESLEPTLSNGIDFLWVIDNSASMAEEQIRVAEAADRFFNLLWTHGTDYRVGVTTVESCLLSDAYSAWPDLQSGMAHDELIDPASGLRGVGFIEPHLANAAELFAQYLTYDEGCLRTDGATPIAPEGSNICGNGFELGLESGLFVLERASSDTRAPFALRPDASTVVIWVSEEQDGALEENPILGKPAPSTSEARALLDAFAADYASYGARTYAIVGDQGTGSGGACDAMSFPAEHGSAYIDLALANGAYSSICATDLEPAVEHITRDALSTQGGYELSGYPIVPTIRVSVDGTVVPRSRSGGWFYDPVSNRLHFAGLPLSEASHVSVVYRIWQHLEG